MLWRIVILFHALLLMTHTVKAVNLAWDSNPEPDVSGYKVHYGTTSGVYTETLDVGNTTNATVSNLSSGSICFLVVTAYNTAGLESLPSAEISFSTNEAPVASNDSIAIDEGSNATIDVLLNDSDPDNGPTSLTIQSVGSAANGTTSVAGNSVIYSPAPGFFGTDDFSYTITDGALTASATLTVNVKSTAVTESLSDSGLTGSNIGSATGGGRVLPDDSWELIGAGIGVVGLGDGVHFESARQTGNFQALVRVQSLTSNGAAPEVGLMLRESTAADARFAMLAATPDTHAYGVRTNARGVASRTAVTVPALFPDVWVLIERIGDTIDFATSTDGVAFKFAGSTLIPSLADEVELGPFVSSGTVGVNARAVVTNYTVIEIASAPSEGGLTAEYFDDMTLTNVKLERRDATVDFSWGTSSPDPSLPSNKFSVRWKGKVEPRYSEPYTFYTVSDDGVRLWIDGVLLIDNWTNHSPTQNMGSITLTAGQKYDIVMEYFENGGSATAMLQWSSARQAKETIPESALTPDNLQNGLTGRYYIGTNFETLALTRVENVNFDWGSGSPAPGILSNDSFSVQWTGSIQPQYSQIYTFYTMSDDGVRLWVNGQLLIDNWSDHSAREDSSTISLVAGKKYDITMEFYENRGDATAKLWWSSPIQSREIVPTEVLYPDVQ